MGIKGLAKLLSDEAPDVCKEEAGKNDTFFHALISFLLILFFLYYSLSVKFH